MTTKTRIKRSVKQDLKERALRVLANEMSYIHAKEFESLTEKQVTESIPEDLYRPDTMQESSDSDLIGLEGALLTAEGEEALFRSMNFAKYQANRLRAQLDPEQPRKKLIEQIERFAAIADKARSTLVEANLRLVASLAHKAANSGFEYEELISEGNMILVNAVDKFDYSRGFRFSTYATHAIQRHFYRQFKRKQRRQDKECCTSTDVLSDIAPYREQEGPLDHRVAEKLMAHFEECLDDREREIINQRFGLNNNSSGDTLKAVAERVGLSKERVRQLQQRAIGKLQDLAIHMKLRLEPV